MIRNKVLQHKMTLLHSELTEKLKQLDEQTLLDLLGVSSEDLVDRFEDIIEDKFERLSEAIEG
jgi:hypothetical protein